MDSCSLESKNDEDNQLTTAQRARIERNRLKALMLKESKLIPHPSAKIETSSVEQSIVKVQGSRFIDSGGGFLIQEVQEERGGQRPQLITSKPAPILVSSERPVCLECNEDFSTSYLYETFDYRACDKCRDNDDKHSLITKTEAKNEYLLKDCDLDLREPPLKCIIRKNPHNNRWGSMKLYLHIQVEERALLVWGTQEALMEEKELRLEKKDVAKSKKYSKELKKLRMNVRSSLYDKSKATHKHRYGEEAYDEENDVYTHVCVDCKYVETYEKM